MCSRCQRTNCSLQLLATNTAYTTLSNSSPSTQISYLYSRMSVMGHRHRQTQTQRYTEHTMCHRAIHRAGHTGRASFSSHYLRPGSRGHCTTPSHDTERPPQISTLQNYLLVFLLNRITLPATFQFHNITFRPNAQQNRWISKSRPDTPTVTTVCSDPPAPVPAASTARSICLTPAAP